MAGGFTEEREKEEKEEKEKEKEEKIFNRSQQDKANYLKSTTKKRVRNLARVIREILGGV